MTRSRKRTTKPEVRTSLITIVHLPSVKEGPDRGTCGVHRKKLLPQHRLAQPGEKVPRNDVCLTCETFAGDSTARVV